MIAGEAAAAVGALILGEYEFAGAIPFVAGVLFGLAVAEVMMTVARAGTLRMAAWAGLMSGGGILWAVWISSGRGVAPMPTMGYVAVGLGAVVAGGWVALPSRGRGPRRTDTAQTKA